jgi:hypothetical protein
MTRSVTIVPAAGRGASFCRFACHVSAAWTEENGADRWLPGRDSTPSFPRSRRRTGPAGPGTLRPSDGGPRPPARWIVGPTAGRGGSGVRVPSGLAPERGDGSH